MIRLSTLVTGLAVIGLTFALACGPNGDRRAESEETRSSSPADGVVPIPAPVVDDRPLIVVLGDSLTAGLGLEPEEAYPTLLQQKVDEAGLRLRVVNAGVSGDTSAGGLSRVDLALEGDVRVLVVALGGNDALRALPPDDLRRNLAAIIERAKTRHIAVVLAGMEAPPNFGRDYAVSFHQVYPSLSKEYDVTLLPFLLDGVAGVEPLNQRDGIHPTAEGAQKVADHVWTVLEPVARAAAKGSPHR